MIVRSQLSTGGLVILVLACSLFCIASTAEEVGGDTGYFEITSAPSGGAVYFDGSYKGTTPITFPGTRDRQPVAYDKGNEIRV